MLLLLGSYPPTEQECAKFPGGCLSLVLTEVVGGLYHCAAAAVLVAEQVVYP
jgi:hypothetical protein